METSKSLGRYSTEVSYLTDSMVIVIFNVIYYYHDTIYYILLLLLFYVVSTFFIKIHRLSMVFMVYVLYM